MKKSDNNEPANNYMIKNIICFSHLRWDFVYQRPQHLMSRFSKQARVFYIEEPVFDTGKSGYIITKKDEGLYIVVPHVLAGTDAAATKHILKQFFNSFLEQLDLKTTLFWYYTPMALAFSAHVTPALSIFDCMDELSAFQFAPPELLELERKLFQQADIVFTGGYSLHQHKKKYHHNIHMFPSSIDKKHFAKARIKGADPADQEQIPHPRFGFSGVIDERFDVALLEAVSRRNPQWQFVIVGPVVKIDPAILPKSPNIHYLGSKNYADLPAYFSGWDVAMIPFAINESTRFISPTKTPEYLAAGLPVISTPITDVVNPYGESGLVHIASTPEAFERAGRQILQQKTKRISWLAATDKFLEDNSWDIAFTGMQALIRKTLTATTSIPASAKAATGIQTFV